MTRRKTVRRTHEPGDLHELTFSCQNRRPLLVNSRWRHALSTSIDLNNTETGTLLVGYVFMPEHVHLLILPTDTEFVVGNYLASVKRPVARFALDSLLKTSPPPRLLEELTVEDRPGHRCFRFWLSGGGYDRNLFTNRAIRASLEYIHLNPVKRGLRTNPIDWAWSSARAYSGDPVIRDRSVGPKVRPWSER